MTDHTHHSNDTTKRIHPIDVHIGQRVEQRCKELDINIETLAARTGENIGMLDRMMRGAEKIHASQLFDLTHVLHVSVGFFFEKYQDEINKDFERLSKAFLQLPDSRHREQFISHLEDHINNLTNQKE